MPVAFRKLFKTKHDYGLNTVAQQNAGGILRYWPRGAHFHLTIEISRLMSVDRFCGAFGGQLGCWVDVSRVA